MKTEFICRLNGEHDCRHRRYDKRLCELKISDDFAVAACEYRTQAIELPVAAEPEESPVPVAQQPQPKSADDMHVEIEQCF